MCLNSEIDAADHSAYFFLKKYGISGMSASKLYCIYTRNPCSAFKYFQKRVKARELSTISGCLAYEPVV